MSTAKLPFDARAKLNSIKAFSDDADALAIAATASVKATETQVERVLHAIRTEANEARIAELKKEADALGRELEALRSASAERMARKSAARALVAALSGWIDRLPVSATLAMVSPPAREPTGEHPRAAVDRLRGEIKELRGQMDALRRAPLSRAEAKQFAVAWVDQRAKHGRPVIAPREDGVDIVFEATRKPLVPGDRTSATASTDFLIWLHRDAVLEAMMREVDASAALDGGITRDERAAQLASLRAQLLDAERAEEAAIARAADDGTIIARRGDADPRAVLGVEFTGAVRLAAA